MFTVQYETMTGTRKTLNLPGACSIEDALEQFWGQVDCQVGNVLAVFYDGIRVA